jgi:hypothetical protein
MASVKMGTKGIEPVADSFDMSAVGALGLNLYALNKTQALKKSV